MSFHFDVKEEPSKSLVLSVLTGIRPHHLVVGCVAFYLLQAIYSITLHPLRGIPGPFAAKFTELWRTRKYLNGKWHDDICDLHRKYGPVVRISPNEVSFVDKAALIKVYGHSTGTKKTSWYHVWDVPNASTGFFAATDVKEHAFLRKRVATAYTMSTVLALEPALQEVADALWVKFHQMARSGESIDMQLWSGYFAFDIVTKLGLGESLGFVRQGQDVNAIMESVQGFFWVLAGIGYMPGQQWWINNPIVSSVLKFLGPSSLGGQAAFSGWLFQQVTTRMAQEDAGNPKDRTRDMLDHFISMKEPDGSKVGLPGVVIEGGNLIGAGADTTAVGISVVLGQLLTHPEAYARVQREVDEAFVRHSISGPSCLTYLIAEKIPFLNAVIKEATRLCPSILWQLPREAPADGITIDGHYIPSSATLSMSPIAQNRCREIFGDDAEEWRPERFIVDEKGTTAEQVKEMDKYMVTFGFGSRTCVGRNLALVELHKFVGQFVRQFDCELVNPSRPFVRRSQWFCLQEDLLLRVKARA